MRKYHTNMEIMYEQRTENSLPVLRCPSTPCNRCPTWDYGWRSP